MKKLTRREKWMLYILACVIVAAGGLRFLILPALTSYSNLKSEAGETKATEAEMRRSIDDSETVQQKTDELDSKLSADSASFYAPMSDWELDHLVTNMLTKHNLKPQSLHVTSPVKTEIKSFSENSSKAKANTSSTTQASDDGDMLVSEITADVLGTRSDFIALSDEIGSTPSLRITGFYMADNGQSGDSAITIDIEVLMYDKNEG